MNFNLFLPDTYSTRKINETVLALYSEREYLEDFYKNIYFYGAPFKTAFNGGRIETEFSNSFLYKNYSVTLTNKNIQKEHLQDTPGNIMLDRLNMNLGTAIISSDILYEHIKSNFSNINIKWSTTYNYGYTQKNRIGTVNILSAYDKVVLPVDLNNVLLHNPELFHYKNNIEVLVNEACPDDCPFRNEHYSNISDFYLDYGIEKWVNCKYYNGYRNHTPNYSHNIQKYRLSELHNIGIQDIKLQGRGSSIEEIINTYSAYLPKDEYKLEFKERLLKWQEY